MQHKFYNKTHFQIPPPKSVSCRPQRNTNVIKVHLVFVRLCTYCFLKLLKLLTTQMPEFELEMKRAHWPPTNKANRWESPN